MEHQIGNERDFGFMDLQVKDLCNRMKEQNDKILKIRTLIGPKKFQQHVLTVLSV